MVQTLTSNEETWRDIPGFGSRYQISTFGMIKTTFRSYQMIITPKLMTCRSERPFVTLTDPETNKESDYYIDSLVMKTFFADYSPDCSIRHKDRDPRNNRIDNLYMYLQGEPAV